MKKVFSSGDSRLDWLAEGGSLLVPTRRLAFHLRDLFDAEATRAGLRVWPTADVLTWPDLIERLFRQQRDASADPPQWLTPAASRLIWDATIRADSESAALLSLAGVPALAQRAWQRIHEYAIPMSVFDAASNAELAAFARWATTYRQQLVETNCVDIATAPQALDPLALRSWTLALTGFDALTPQQARFIETGRERGIDLPTLGAPVVTARIECRVCTNTEAEYDAAARWAARQIDSTPTVRVAIVVNGLDAERDRVRRCLDRVLCPASGQTGGPLPGTLAFSIAAGRPLSAWPITAAALELLARFCHRSTGEPATALLREPYLEASREEGTSRAMLDAQLRRSPGSGTTLESLQSRADRAGCPRLAQALRGALDLRTAWPSRAAPSVWSREFARLLGALGWPGVALDSAEHQARERWLEALAELGSCDAITGLVTASEALRLLRLIADAAQFEPEQAASAVVVIDPQTCAGMQFDALWCCGLEASRWPAPAVPDPFLPWDWQRTRQIPGTTAENCERDAARVFARLGHSAAQVVFSRPQTERDAELLASPLLNGLAPSVSATDWPRPTLTRALFDARPALEQLAEVRFPALADGAMLRGGAAVLAHQSACAFRAQAEHRLHARALEQPPTGIDAATRGVLMHQVLERLWRELRSSVALAEIDAESLARLIEQTIDAVVAPLKRTHDVAYLQLLALEARWLRARVLDLFAIDRERTAFEVVDCEKPVELALEGIRLQLKLDRVDRLASGDLAVVDYKTSSQTEPTSWTGERPAMPQLPAYALAIGPEKVGAVAFAALRVGDTRYHGLVRDVRSWPGLRTPGTGKGRVSEFVTWETMIALWWRRIGVLMRELREGVATLAYDPANACARCHLGTLCRIAEVDASDDEFELVQDVGDAGDARDEATLDDAVQRARALDVTTSFIVQAPAGSGKTELLIRRYLALLATVEHPESVLAITFTRKAAAEMRQRILIALRSANDAPGEPTDPLTLSLARAALRADERFGWRLLGNPARLRILTIDAFNLALARRLPVLSGIGAGLAIEERAQPLYRAAAERLLSYVGDPDGSGAAVAHLLEHFDNRAGRFVDLIVELLRRREDWLAVLQPLRHGVDERELRMRLEQALADLVDAHVRALHAAFPPGALEEAAELAHAEAPTIRVGDKREPLRVYLDHACVPGNGADDAHRWLALAELLLNVKGDWRMRYSSGVTGRALDLIDRLDRVVGLRESLHAIRGLPPRTYSEHEWRTLVAMLDALPLAASELQLEFADTGRADYACFAAAARQALGTDEEPTDVALALDARLRHVLVDEFQDTSLSQVRLLERLTAEWMPGDGNTLFLVGDPMQSIYRFRNAEVEQFLAARAHGIGRLPLEPVTLAVNFRSTRPVVDWHNEAFGRVLPATDDLRRGAVAFTPSRPAPSSGCEGRVVVHAFLRRSREAEAVRVADIVTAARTERSEGTVAILVSGRAHLVEIVAELQRRGIAFQATDIDPLAKRPVVLDLLALTRALSHVADRTSWLAVLRAPWCGLALADLFAIAGDRRDAVLDILRDAAWRSRVGRDAQARIDRTLAVLERALDEMRRLGLRDAVERAWHALGGPATVADEHGLEEAAAYLDQLSMLEARSRGPLDFADLEEALAELHAPPDPRPGLGVQILTIHRAKGLQFDTVILPGLERTLRGERATLLKWTATHEPHRDAIVVAPVQALGSDRNPLYAWLDGIARDQARHERERLLYVAATRARSELHLLGSVAVQTTPDGLELRAPSRTTPLGILWPVVRSDFERQLELQGAGEGEAPPEIRREPVSRRFPSDWRAPPSPRGPRLPAPEVERATSVLTPEFDWASETARRVGTVVHRELQRCARERELPDEAALMGRRRLFTVELAELGVPPSMQESALERVMTALRRTIADPRGRWLFDASHRGATAELAVTGRTATDTVSVAVDRTFLDASGVRWIVDYKTSMHEGGGLDAFLDREQERYRPQLDRYAELLRELGPEPIRLGLYFPLFSAWREWPAK